MDKYEFINRLEKALGGLSAEEKNAAVSYYKELFEDAGSDREQELIANLGSPEAAAENIIRESGMVGSSADFSEKEAENTSSSADNGAPSNKEKKRSGTAAWLVILLVIVTFPLWIGFVAAGGGILIAVIAVAFSLLIAVGVAGAVLFATGFTVIFSSIGVGVLLLGLGLLVIGLLILLVVPLFKCAIKLCSWVINGFVKLVRLIFWGREAVA